MSHTPGPWEAIIERHDRNHKGGFSIQPVGSRVVISGRAGWPDRMEESASNAQLMAAAPDLLQACKDTMDYWDSTGFSDCQDGCDCIVDQMRAAIAKAEHP